MTALIAAEIVTVALLLFPILLYVSVHPEKSKKPAANLSISVIAFALCAINLALIPHTGDPINVGLATFWFGGGALFLFKALKYHFSPRSLS